MTLESKVLDWFGSGRVGASSKCLALHLTGHPSDGSYPCDPDDFNRCYGLLKAVPELREKIPQMAEVNDYWKALVERWYEIEECLVKEIGEDGNKGHRAPLTYELMRSIYDPIDKKYRPFIHR